MAGHIKTWIEIGSNGKFGETHAYVVISVGPDQEFRYEIPGVIEASWECSHNGVRTTLVLADVQMNTRVEINSDTAKMEDLMTEIVASRLAHDDDDKSIKYAEPMAGPIGRVSSAKSNMTMPPKATVHAPHCNVTRLGSIPTHIGNFAASCNCGAVPK